MIWRTYVTMIHITYKNIYSESIEFASHHSGIDEPHEDQGEFLSISKPHHSALPWLRLLTTNRPPASSSRSNRVREISMKLKNISLTNSLRRSLHSPETSAMSFKQRFKNTVFEPHWMLLWRILIQDWQYMLICLVPLNVWIQIHQNLWTKTLYLI